jgi:hypothetical protein
MISSCKKFEECETLEDKKNYLIKKLNISDEEKKLFVHGSNILGKIKNLKSNERDKIDVLNLIVQKYCDFLKVMKQNHYYTYYLFPNLQKRISKEKLLRKKINKFIEYKEFVKQKNKKKNKPVFSSQSKFESTIIEEFLYHLFNEYEKDNIKVGSVKAYSSLYFSAKNYESFKNDIKIKVNEKDQDFAIYRAIKLELKDKEKILSTLDISIPIIAIECKTYLDKTMLEGSVATAEKIKIGNPHCKFFIVTEAYDVDYKVDISTSRIDNIFVLRKGKSKDNNPIDSEVIIKLYNTIVNYLEQDWENIEYNIKSYGLLFNN